MNQLLTTISKITVMSLAVLLLSDGTAVVQAQVTCGDVITDKRVLETDLACGTNPALTINGGKLDMAGHRVTGVGDCILLAGIGSQLSNGSAYSCGGHGVMLEGSKHKITSVVSTENSGAGFFAAADITGVKFTNTSAVLNDAGYYFFVGPASKNKFSGAVASRNVSTGFTVLGDENKVSECTAFGNGFYGFGFNGNKNKFSRNIADGNQYGFQIGGNENKLKQNTASGGSTDFGFNMGGNDNTLTKNVSVRNADEGFVVVGTGNQLTKCVAVDNAGTGFSIQNVNNSVKGGRAERNGVDGILVVLGATGNLITKNVALENLSDDLQDNNASCAAGNNGWSKNVFGESEDGGTGCIE